MADIEKEVEAMILAGLGDKDTTVNPQSQQDPPHEQEPERKVIDVGLYRFPNGAVLLVPGETANPLDTNAVESDPPLQDTDVPLQATPTEEKAAREEETAEQGITETPTLPLAPTSKRGTYSYMLVPLVLLLLLSGGAASYFFVLPLTASATVTITPDTKTLHTQTTVTIAASPKESQVQGRTLVPFSLAESKTVATTGHGHL